MARTAKLPPDPDDVRRRRLLEAALATFLRFGFRKTSMEEVARAAGLSRQGLYLHFATKEELFGAAIRHALETGLDAARAALREGATADRLTAAFDAWVGRFVGMPSADVSELEEATGVVVAPLIAEHERHFLDAVTKVIRASKLPAAYKPAGVTATQLADQLHATARGLKHLCANRAEFRDRFSAAVRALCLPLVDRGPAR